MKTTGSTMEDVDRVESDFSLLESVSEDLIRRHRKILGTTSTWARRVGEERHRLANALTEKHRLASALDSVLENLDAGVVLLSESGEVMAENHEARRLNVVKVLDRLEPQSSGTIRVPTAEGGEQRWLVRRRDLSLSENASAELIVVHDATELLELKERAARRSRLEAMGRMAAEIAHEVRNPLGSLELLTSMLVDDLEPSSQAKAQAAEILVEVRRLSAIVSRLLAGVRESRPRYGEVDLCALVEAIVDFVRPMADAATVRIEVIFGSAVRGCEEGRAQLDGQQVRQAMLNLLRNALDHSPPEGTIRVVVQSEEHHLAVSVEDQGPGIPVEMRRKVTEPFVSTRDLGTGLGLSVVTRVVDSHGGRLVVDQSDLGGAALTMILPRRRGGTVARVEGGDKGAHGR